MHSHRLYEDVAAALTGTALFTLGLALLSKATLLAGGIPGLALLVHYATGGEVWLLIILLNLPFYALSLLRMGWKLTVRTVLAVLLVAALIRLIPDWIAIERVDPLYAALVGGVLMGMGLLVLIRHRTTLGGVSILALYAQDRFGLRAGYVQLGIDAAIVAASFFVIAPREVLLSLLGAAVLNMVIAMNHRPGRYLGMS